MDCEEEEETGKDLDREVNGLEENDTVLEAAKMKQ